MMAQNIFEIYILIKVDKLMYYNTPGGAGGSSFDRISNSYKICSLCNEKYYRSNNTNQICLVCENENLKNRYSRETRLNMSSANGPIKPNQSDYSRV
jgi:hypothetical protein